MVPGQGIMTVLMPTVIARLSVFPECFRLIFLRSGLGG